MRNLIKLLISRALRVDIYVPHRCFAERYKIPENDICDCIDVCKYNSPNAVYQHLKIQMVGPHPMTAQPNLLPA